MESRPTSGRLQAVSLAPAAATKGGTRRPGPAAASAPSGQAGVNDIRGGPIPRKETLAVKPLPKMSSLTGNVTCRSTASLLQLELHQLVVDPPGVALSHQQHLADQLAGDRIAGHEQHGGVALGVPLGDPHRFLWML